jgi:hypothetical protein
MSRVSSPYIDMVIVHDEVCSFHFHGKASVRIVVTVGTGLGLGASKLVPYHHCNAACTKLSTHSRVSHR